MSIVLPPDPDLIVLGYNPGYFVLALVICIGAILVLEPFFAGRSK